jgi:hypothetical protein
VGRKLGLTLGLNVGARVGGEVGVSHSELEVWVRKNSDKELMEHRDWGYTPFKLLNCKRSSDNLVKEPNEEGTEPVKELE